MKTLHLFFLFLLPQGIVGVPQFSPRPTQVPNNDKAAEPYLVGEHPERPQGRKIRRAFMRLRRELEHQPLRRAGGEGREGRGMAALVHGDGAISSFSVRIPANVSITVDDRATDAPIAGATRATRG